MFSKNKPKIGIDIKKNVIRYCSFKKGQFICGEKIAREDFFKNGKLKNKEEFRTLLNEIFKETHSISPLVVVPALNSKLLIKHIPIQEMETEKEIREFLFFELGESISLPFDNPLFDLLILDPPKKKKRTSRVKKKESKKNETETKLENKPVIKRNRFTVNGKVPVCITPEEVLEQVGNTVQKSGGQLSGVDFSALAYTNVLKKEINWRENFALVEIDSGEATITIFEKMVPVYVQYEDYNKINWRYNEVDGQIVPEYKEESESLSILGDTIRNVVKYFEDEISSEESIGNIYLVGGHPRLKQEVLTIIHEKNTISVHTLTSTLEKIKVPDRFLLAFGLALKELS
ncbi:hypothetical protein ABG953_12535 [Enterococcus faecalis]|nr:hypothetical protein [Enterococcus faecalis]